MMRRLTAAILLLYPKRVRRRHGAELAELTEELIVRERRSQPAVLARLALDGVCQRVTATAAAWTAVAVLATTTFAGLAVTDFAAASANQPLVHHPAAHQVQHRTAQPGRHGTPQRAQHSTHRHRGAHRPRRLG